MGRAVMVMLVTLVCAGCAADGQSGAGADCSALRINHNRSASEDCTPPQEGQLTVHISGMAQYSVGAAR